MIRKSFLSSVLALAIGASAAAPAVAIPLPTAPASIAAGGSLEITQVRHQQRFRQVPRGFYSRGGAGFYNGYRGRRHHRRGWRRHNGWWFPPAAFALGVIIGNGLYDGSGYYYRERPRRYYRSNYLPYEHYRWCEWRFRTYRAWDNTYIPRVGYRSQCRSPYWP